MNESGSKILACLGRVSHERELRAADAVLAGGVGLIKAFQHARFAATYSDLIDDARYRDATMFFLEDIYGPGDFSERDAQFARIVPALVRLFPREIVSTVAELGELHALSEQLDTAMGRQLGTAALDGRKYGELWREVGDAFARNKQVDLMFSVGHALDSFTRRAVLRHSLRVMRRPAQAAGLGALQAFLERGFDTFRAMRGADDFLSVVSTRERALSAHLFQGGSVSTC